MITIEKLKWSTGNVTAYEFPDIKKEKAKSHFIELCDQYNLDNWEETETGMEAGGIGYDYRLTMTFNVEQ